MRALLFLACAGATYWSARLAWADHLCRASSEEEVRRGVTLAAGDAQCWLRLAALEAARGGNPEASLERAAGLAPDDFHVWIELGIRAEARGDLARAEQYLLRSAGASTQYLPRWTLANYYFRRGDEPHFWHWTRAALDTAWSDPAPLFRLCWNMAPDPRRILEHAIPPRPQILNAYLQFLIATDRLDAALPVASRLAAVARANDLSALLWYEDKLLARASVQPATELWNALCARRLLGYTPLSLEPLTNADFAIKPLGAGFDWRLPDPIGVSVARSRGEPLLVAFSGRQPDRCAALWQLVPVSPGARYRLGFTYRTNDIAPGTGLQWRIRDGRTGAEIPADSPQLSSSEWQQAETTFRSPPDTQLVSLELAYQRSPGTTRIEGSLRLRDLRWSAAP